MLKVLLDCHSYFSFGRGVSSPTRLVERAAELSYTALALVDENGVYGAVEAQRAGKKYGVKVLVGATVTLTAEGEGYPLVLIAQNRSGYEVLCDLLTAVHADEEKLGHAPYAAGSHPRPDLPHGRATGLPDPPAYAAQD